jgi:peptidoglycan/LPS O-acetylase OafA/YrhL
VLLVVLAHAGVGFVGGGFVGVDVFFVLSGFLITGLLLAEARKHGSVSLLDFYVRRARRILPAAALALLVTDVATFFLTNFVRAGETVDDSLHAAGFAANFHFAERGVDYFAEGNAPSPILHYWSLSVEEQFYLVWPLLLALALFGVAFLRRRRGVTGRERRLLGLVIVLASGSLLWSIYLTASAPTAAYYSPFTRAWELGLGAALAVGAPTIMQLPGALKVVLGWSGLAAIAVAAVGFSDGTPFPGSAALLPTVGTACAIAAGMGSGASRLAASRVLAVRPMSIVGDRSYALYLWHWPVLILAADYAGHEPPAAVKLGLVVGAFLLSCISYALVENPIRRRVHSRRMTGIVVLVCMSAFLGTAMISLAGIEQAERSFQGAVASADGATPRGIDGPTSTANGALPTVTAAVEAARRGAALPKPLRPALRRLKGLEPAYRLQPECVGHDVSNVVATKVCRVGDVSSKKVVVLMGDSHAMMWVPAVTEMAWHDHVAVVPLLRLGCTPGKWLTSGSGKCDAWFQWAVGEIRRLHPQVVLVGGSIDQEQTPYARAAIEGVVGAAQRLRVLGRTAVIGDPEGLDFEPVDRLVSRKASMSTCTTTWPPGALRGYDEVRVRVRSLGVGFVETRALVSFERSYPAVIGHTIVWVDDNHMSSMYSASVAGAFRKAYFSATADSG